MTKPLLLASVSRDGDGRSATVPSCALTARAEEQAAGNALTLDAIYRQHAPAVTRWVTHLVGRDVEIEDIVHEVFLVVHRRLRTFRGDSRLTTWLYGIAIRVVADRRRGRRWRRRFGLRGGGEAERAALAAQRASGPSALDILETEEAKRVVYGVLDRLSEPNRTALILFEIEGLSGQEIAAILGTSVDRVWMRLHRARKQFTRHYLAWEAASATSKGKAPL